MALEGETPDQRRKGVVGLAASRDGQSEWATKVYLTVARKDSDPMVRCAALRALAPVPDSQTVTLTLQILSNPRQTDKDARPANGPVRWDAARLLHRIIREDGYDPAQRGDIMITLLDRAANDRDRNVRLTCIDSLGYFHDAAVLTALIDILREDDYAMQHAAETSLIAMTGVTHHHDAESWRTWVTQTKEPFADAGQIPDDLCAEQRSRNRWDWEW
jgi:HEAT repeat protein